MDRFSDFWDSLRAAADQFGDELYGGVEQNAVDVSTEPFSNSNIAKFYRLVRRGGRHLRIAARRLLLALDEVIGVYPETPCEHRLDIAETYLKMSREVIDELQKENEELERTVARYEYDPSHAAAALYDRLDPRLKA